MVVLLQNKNNGEGCNRFDGSFGVDVAVGLWGDVESGFGASAVMAGFKQLKEKSFTKRHVRKNNSQEKLFKKERVKD